VRGEAATSSGDFDGGGEREREAGGQRIVEVDGILCVSVVTA